MSRTDFLNALKRRLSGIPEEDANNTLDYYSEMIFDHIEEGMSEEEAVASLGSMDEIVTNAIAEVPLKRIVNERLSKRKRLDAWQIALIVLASPIWIPLLIAAGGIFIAIIATVFSLIAAGFAIVFATGVTCVAWLFDGVKQIMAADFSNAALTIGAALILAGLFILLFIAARHFARFMIRLIEKLFVFIKKTVAGKEKTK